MKLVLFLVTVLSIVRALNGCPTAVAFYPPPTYQAPYQQAPTYQAPTYQAPTYQAPIYQAPIYQAPSQPPHTQAPSLQATTPAPTPIPDPVVDCNLAFNSTGAAKCCPSNPNYWGPFLNCTRWCIDNPTACASPGRRHLEVVTSQELLDGHGGSACFNSQYDLYVVHIRNHFSLLGLPSSNSDTISKCPYIATHVSLMWVGDTARPEKNLMVVHDEMVRTFPEERKQLLGVRKLSELLAAFDQVTVRHEMFDIVENNCAKMIREMVGILGIPLGADVANFIKWRILQSSVVDYIRQSPSFTKTKIFSNLTDEEVVSQVFDMYNEGF